ncbi:MAG: hypothetical protein U9O98_05805, partial [Asgard group archaeon]|nr:hypothetical protein [Asgard group archaeon]
FELISFYLRSEKLKKVDQYLGELEILASDLQTPSVNTQMEYLKGFYELVNHNFSNSITYFQKSLDMAQQTKDVGLILTSNIQLTATYLQKYRLNEKAETLNLALNYIDTAIKLARENKHNQITAIALIIRSVLLAIKGAIEKAYDDISLAKEIMKESDYEIWKEEIQSIEASLSNALEEGKMILDRENLFKNVLPQFKSILSLRIGERKIKESKVLGLLIITKSGVPVVSKLSQKLKTNQLILSGLITAINQLAESIIEGEDKGRLQEVLYDKFWITIQPIKNGIVAVIATDATAEIRLWANIIAERIQEVPITINEFTTIVEEKIADLLEEMHIQ